MGDLAATKRVTNVKQKTSQEDKYRDKIKKINTKMTTTPQHDVNDRVSVVQHSSASKKDKKLGNSEKSNRLKTKK